MDFTNTRGTGTTVTRLMTVDLIDVTGAATPLDTEFAYDPKDPFAVSATFMTVAGQVRWTFSRELLSDGLREPSGDGDVHVWPCEDNQGRPVVIIELCSPDGEALVQVRTSEITAFVQRMNAAVAPGNEQVDVDSAIAAILAADV